MSEYLDRKYQSANHRLLNLGVCLILCALTFATGCKPFGLRPISERALSQHGSQHVGNWAPDQRVMPYAEINGSQYFLHNIRQCHYLSFQDFVVDYQDRLIDLSQIQTVDFIVVPFKPNSPLAHTMVSFGLDDGSYLCLSVESRRQVGDSYQALAGLTRGYDLIYMLGDERDLIGVRTDHFNVEVYVFPTMVGPDKAQAFFTDVVRRMNELKTNPEFYNLLSNNCTTNLKDHVNNISPNRIRPFTMGTLFTGFSARNAHKIGLIENRIPFEDLQTICYINELAKDNLDRPDFSQLIRSRRYQIDRELARQQHREPTLRGRGDQMLNQAMGSKRLSRANAVFER